MTLARVNSITPIITTVTLQDPQPDDDFKTAVSFMSVLNNGVENTV